MRHIEFFHNDHFETEYHRVPPPPGLGTFIDFFWETRFENLWAQYPKGFSDAQFPNIGYTYIINLGTPFVMQVDDQKFQMRSDGFLPRQHAIECFHKPGNHFFGIKFRISPIILEKKINFSEYRGYVFPLSYLLEQSIIDQIKKAKRFEERTAILCKYFLTVLAKHEDGLQQAMIVSHLLDRIFQKNEFDLSLEKEAARLKISLRTLQRYFENCTGMSSKQAIQLMRIRKAVTQLVNDPAGFRVEQYGYYDQSHFYKHLRQFLQQTTFHQDNLHRQLLTLLQKPGKSNTQR